MRIAILRTIGCARYNDSIQAFTLAPLPKDTWDCIPHITMDGGLPAFKPDSGYICCGVSDGLGANTLELKQGELVLITVALLPEDTPVPSGWIRTKVGFTEGNRLHICATQGRYEWEGECAEIISRTSKKLNLGDRFIMVVHLDRLHQSHLPFPLKEIIVV